MWELLHSSCLHTWLGSGGSTSEHSLSPWGSSYSPLPWLLSHLQWHGHQSPMSQHLWKAPVLSQHTTKLSVWTCNFSWNVIAVVWPALTGRVSQQAIKPQQMVTEGRMKRLNQIFSSLFLPQTTLQERQRSTPSHAWLPLLTLQLPVSQIVSFCGLLDRPPEWFPKESSPTHSEEWNCSRAPNLRFWGMHRRREMPYILCALEDTKCQAGKEVTSRQQPCRWSQLETCSLCKGK